MRWVRANVGWMAAVLTLLGAAATGYLALYVRSALAAPETRITALETHRTHDAADLADMKRKIDDIHRYLLGDIKR
jgi:hypothetical protein